VGPSCRAKLLQQNEVREMMSIHKDQFNELMNRLKATGYELAATPAPNWVHVGEMSRIVQGLHDILGDE